METDTMKTTQVELNLLSQLQDAKDSYYYHKEKREWYEASKWADIHSHINREIHKLNK